MSHPDAMAIMALFQGYCYDCEWRSPICYTQAMAEEFNTTHLCGEPIR